MIRVIYTGTRAPCSSPRGLTLAHIPALSTMPLLEPGEEEELAEWLAQPHQLLFFSRHAITAVHRAPLPTHHTQRVWCVGKRTASQVARTWPTLEEQISTPPKNQQHYQGVINSIAEVRCSWPLYAVGLEGARRPVAQDVYALMGDAAPPVYHVDAYRSLVRREFEQELERALEARVDWVLFASPRAVLASEHVMKGSGARIAAIGRTTSDAIEALGMTCDLVASTPSMDVLLAEVLATRT